MYGSSKELLQVLEQKPVPGQQGPAISAVTTVIFDMCLFKYEKNSVWIQKIAISDFFLVNSSA